ncbi:LacI family transcriptional regulator [Microbacterium sp. Y-01]|uniref:LacI family DNA-binding transcriptional regulator n=1 Tax=Microbacterium sp. Y-01 TaxID=2048898 RepID=UPI000F5F84C8|nr:LacI family DNA-binding transcriptional regulator [Microbacterium sp. Y-01]AZH79326.1 LacI family transcriptional regulator [Microbacterium sp. Y-01]
MRVTLADIAEATGVSESTVSRVLNGKPGVSEATRRRVREALRRTEYLDERELPSSQVVGVLLPELHNPIFGLFGRQLDMQLSLQGVRAIVAQGRTVEDEDDFAEFLLRNSALGLVIVAGSTSNGTRRPESLRSLVERGLQVVSINGPSGVSEAPTLSTDFSAGVERAIRHLRNLGHERIGLATGPPAVYSAQLQIAGFAREAGAAERGLVVSGLYSIEGGDMSTTELLQKGATAIVYGSDIMALGGLRAAARNGLSVPGDLSIVGLDDSAFMLFTDPSLTTIRQPIESIAEEAALFLVRRLVETSGAPSMVLFQPELVVRSSTGAATAVESGVDG